MISPHTPPRTHLVVTWNPDEFDEKIKTVAEKYRHMIEPMAPGLYSHFHLGQRLVLEAVVPMFMATTGFAARVIGHRGSYALEHFSVAELPKVLTELLVPVVEDA